MLGTNCLIPYLTSRAAMDSEEWTGAGVECQTLVPEVPGSILSGGADCCGLEQVTNPHRSWGNDPKLIDSVYSKKIKVK